VEAVRIGAIYAKSGKAAISNSSSFRAVRFAVAELNRRGGLLGHPVDLLEYDNRSTALGSRAAARRAVEDGVIGVIGASWSSHSLAMAPVLQAAGIPMISNSSTHPDLTRVGNFIFRVCYNDRQQGEALARFAYGKKGVRRMVVITNTGSKYSLGLSDTFSQAFTALGGEVLWRADYLRGVTDFEQMLLKIKQIDPQMIFLPSHEVDAAEIIATARNLGLPQLFLGADAWTDLMFETAGSTLDGNYYSTHWFANSDKPVSQAFVTAYSRQHGEIKRNGVGLAYDAVMLLANAVTRADSLRPVQIREMLATTRDFDGVTGRITIDANGDPTKEVFIMRFASGSSELVATIRSSGTGIDQ